MKSVVGWEVVCDSKHRAWINGQPVQCQHRHRTVEAMHACVVKRLMAGDLEDVTLNVTSGRVTLPMGKAPKPKTISQRLTVEQVEKAMHASGLQTQQQPLTCRTIAEHMQNAPDTREHGPATNGTTSLQSIVNAINVGVV